MYGFHERIEIKEIENGVLVRKIFEEKNGVLEVIEEPISDPSRADVHLFGFAPIWFPNWRIKELEALNIR
jgi:hypothetical protein